MAQYGSTYYDPISGSVRTNTKRTLGSSGIGQFAAGSGWGTARGGAGDQTGAAQGGGGVPGVTSYADILGSDPMYQQTLADLGAQNVGDREGLRAARQRAVVQFGEVPDFSTLDQTAVGSDFAGDIDQPTRLLAGTNTQEGLSVAARIAKQNADNVRSLTNYLSSRGLLRSGEAGYRLGEEQQNYKTAQYDSRQKLLDFLGQYQSGYMQGLAQRRQAQTAAAGGAFDRATSIYGNTNFGPQTPAAPAATTTPVNPPVVPPVAQAPGGSPYYGQYAQPTNRGTNWRPV